MFKKDYIRTLLKDEDNDKELKKLKEQISLINLGQQFFYKNVYDTNIIGGTTKDLIIAIKKDFNNINSFISKVLEYKEQLKKFIKIDDNFIYIGNYKFPLQKENKIYLKDGSIYYKKYILNPDLTLKEELYLITKDKIEKLDNPLEELELSLQEEYINKKYKNILNKYKFDNNIIIKTQDKKFILITEDLKEQEIKNIKVNTSYISFIKEGYKFEKRLDENEKQIENLNTNLNDIDILDIIYKNRENIDLNKYPIIEQYVEYFINKYNDKIIKNNSNYFDNLEHEINKYYKKSKNEQEYSELYKKIRIKNMVDKVAKHTTYITKNKIDQINSKHKKEENKLKEIQELLKNNKYIKDIELDPSVDLDKIIMLLKHIHSLKINLENPFTLKVRLLGNYKAGGIYFYNGNIVAVDPKEPSSLLHEITHLIDLNRNNNKVINEKVKNFEEYRKYIIEHFKRKIKTKNIQSKIDYYLKDVEIIARLGEIYALLNNPEIAIVEKSLPIINLYEEYIDLKNIYFNFDEFTKEDKQLLQQFFSLYFDFENLNILKQQDFSNIKKLQIDKYTLENKKLRKKQKQSFNHLPLLTIYNPDFENFIKKHSLEENLYEEYSEHTNYFININKLKNIKNKDFAELFLEQLKYLKIDKIINNILDMLFSNQQNFKEYYKTLKKEGKNIPASQLEDKNQKRYYYVCDIRKLKEEDSNINVFEKHFKYNILAAQFLLPSFLRHFTKPEYKIYKLLNKYYEEYKNIKEQQGLKL